MFAMFGLGGMEVAALLVVGVLCFGKRLPEIGRSFGQAIMSFKRGLAGVEDEIETAASRPSVPQRRPAVHDDDAHVTA